MQNLRLLNQDADLAASVKEPLMKLCAFYICKVKRRGYALDAVTNFHLKNGAVVWRLNWMADTTLSGMQNSCGIMVNYRYYLEDMPSNSAKYIGNHNIPVSEHVNRLLRADERSNL